jgi:FkbM family methyltransferase
MSPEATVSLQTVNGWTILPSSLKRPDATPRFNLNFPTHFFSDVGAQHLVGNEVGDGYEPPTRDFIERVLRRGDLFIDVGAHWGFFTMQAATHPAGEIAVISFEPELMNATILTENVVRNKLSKAVTVVCAACGHKSELAPLVTNSTMGHSIRGVSLQQHIKGPPKWVPVVTLDAALASLPAQAERRLILKIDSEGFEPNVIAGAQSLLSGGRIAVIVWECGVAFADGSLRDAMIQMASLLSACGFRHFLPPGHSHDGPPIAFVAEAGYSGNVFSIGPQLMNDPSFGFGPA